MRRSWKPVLAALQNLTDRNFILGFTKAKKVASVTILVTDGVTQGPYSLREAYAWVEAAEAFGAAAWVFS